MIWIDVAIVAIVALSAIIGFFRGFLREALGLATWVLAFYFAFIFAAPVAAHLKGWIDVDSARMAVAFAIVFLAILIVGAIVNHLLGRLISHTGLAGTDRMIGIVFGAVRGVAVLIVLVLLAGVTPVPRDSWWQQSVFIGQLEAGALWARGYLPADIANAISYPDAPSTQPANSPVTNST